MARSPSFAGVILAAGASSRMGRDKALLPWRGGTFLSTAIRALRPVTDFVLVVGGGNAGDLETIVNAHAAFLVVNNDPSQGQFSSLQAGLQEVLNRGRDGAIITLVDRPAADVSTIALLKNTLLVADWNIWAVIPEYNGKHGHPIVIAREMITAFHDAPVTSSAREIEHSLQPHIQYLPVNDPLVVANVDTPEDFARINSETPA